jgi:hypothetical protein
MVILWGELIRASHIGSIHEFYINDRYNSNMWQVSPVSLCWYVC